MSRVFTLTLTGRPQKKLSLFVRIHKLTIFSGVSGPSLQESCSASATCDPTSKTDSGIHRGYSWIISYIIKNWTGLSERVAKEEKEQVETEKKVMKERYRRYHETVETQTQKEDGMNGEAMAVSNGIPVDEVVTKIEMKLDETAPNEHNNTESGKSSSTPTKKKKRKPVIKSNKVSPLIADES